VVDESAIDRVSVVTVPPDARPGRVDRFLADVTGLSRSYVQKLISAGHLTAEGQPLRANAIVTGGTALRLVVPAPEPAALEAESDIEVSIVYEDADLLIVDKPAGLVVHPSPGHSAGTLVNALLGRAGGAEYGGISGVRRPGIVHRLDRDTSGLLMIAKNDAAQASLMGQLKARRVKKTYLALVQGSVAAAVGRVEADAERRWRRDSDGLLQARSVHVASEVEGQIGGRVDTAFAIGGSRAREIRRTLSDEGPMMSKHRCVTGRVFVSGFQHDVISRAWR
jgi:RluA family pseudouridine synthase